MREEINKEIAIDDRLTSSVIGPRGARIGGVRKKTSAMVKIGKQYKFTLLTIAYK